MSELQAQMGDTVYVHYVGRFSGGRVFDTSMSSEAMRARIFNPARDYKPLKIKLGAGEVIPGLEEALIGMKINETKDVIIPPEKGYGKGGNHPMAGKTLEFRLMLISIKRD